MQPGGGSHLCLLPPSMPTPCLPTMRPAPCAACSAFGAKVVDAKPVIKALPPLFAHTQAGVRDKAKEVSVELCAYLGQGVVAGTLLDKMPAAMRKDVDAAIAELPAGGKKQPSRWTRSEAAARAAAAAEAAARGDDPMEVDGAEGSGPAAAAVDADEPVSAAWERSISLCAVPHPCCPGSQSQCRLCWCIEPRLPAICLPVTTQESDAYEFATPVEILGPLGKAQCQVDDDPAVPFWDALEAKKWGLRKVRVCVCVCGGVGGGGRGCAGATGDGWCVELFLRSSMPALF